VVKRTGVQTVGLQRVVFIIELPYHVRTVSALSLCADSAKAAGGPRSVSGVPAMSPKQPASEAPKALDHAYAAERARLLEVFGKRLRAERERRNVSLEGLALLANVHRTHLGALERGKRDPRLTMLLILADALEVAPGALLEGLAVPTERKAPTHSKGGSSPT
jgi:ribosome-binding protein aMBF1 (putative translation factor)